MNRTSSVIVTGLFIVAAIGAAPVMSTAQETTEESNAIESQASAGELLTGVLGVQRAELKGEVDRRTFGIKVARAASNESRADVVSENLDGIEAKLAELKERKQELKEAKANGSISNGSYSAQIAVVAARTANAQSQLNASENATEGLPVELLASKGINTSAIRTLKHNASELSGPEVAAIARRIAGPDIGKSIASNRAPVPVGPPANVGPSINGTTTGNETTTGNATSTDERPEGPPENGPSGARGGRNSENSGARNAHR